MSDTMGLLKRAVETSKQRPLGQARPSPFRVGQVSSVDGIFDIPPTVTLGEGELATEARLGMNVWDVNPYDTVLWITTENGVPVVISRLPGVGSVSLLPEDVDDEPEQWHVVGQPGEPAFASGWAVHSDPTYLTPRFRKQTDGWVKLEGICRRVSGTGDPVFTLPEGYRPEFDSILATCSSNNGHTLCQVTTAGVVRALSNASWGGSHEVYTSLSDITFPTKINPAALIYPVAEGRWSGQEGVPSESPWAFLRADGWVFWNGFLRNTTAPTSSPFTLLRTDGKVTCAPFCELMSVVCVGGDTARFDIGGNSDAGARGPGRIVWQDPTSAKVGVALGGLNYWGTVGARQPWIPLPLANGHTNYGLDHQVGEYLRDSHGRVHLRGLIRRTSATATTIAVLPEGYRPSGRLVFKAPNSPGGFGLGRIDVLSTGAVVASLNPSNWVSLTGINWFAES